MSRSDKIILGAAGGLVATLTVAGAAVGVADMVKNGHKPAPQAFGPKGTDVIVDQGRIYIVKPTVPRL